jgi:hypothetical protein
LEEPIEEDVYDWLGDVLSLGGEHNDSGEKKKNY